MTLSPCYISGVTIALLASTPTATADPAPSATPSTTAEPSSYLEAMADDHRPLRRGFTFELGFGGSLTYVARERADGHTGIGPTTLAVGAGFFVTPKVALLARWSGTTYFDTNAAGETTQVVNELGGLHLQYWANDTISLGAGPALAVVGVNPFFGADGSPQVGFGGSARVGFSVFSAKHHVLRLSWETFNSKIASAFLYGSALAFEWQYF
ncbi:MAG: hypothetical protein JWP87_664 [Labilithrix sp.]|nr:hypothetical protein [Labilithrix sp.]